MNRSYSFDADPLQIIRRLTSLPHRGATTRFEQQAAGIVAEYLNKVGAEVEPEYFRTPTTYISEVCWLVGSLITGLALLSIVPYLSVIVVVTAAVLTILYFDWRRSPVSLLPPRGRSCNVIGKFPKQGGHERFSARVILMAHYDSAPTSFLYRPAMVKDFVRSLKINLALIVSAVIVTLLETLQIGLPVVSWLRYVLIVYFIGQLVLSSIDYLRFGFTTGASDNASGVAIALSSAQRMYNMRIPGLSLEVVFTGAEEAGMKGSAHYFSRHKEELSTGNTFILNFDNLGAGDLKYITRTGSVTNVIYDNLLVDCAQDIVSTDTRFKNVKPARWHTGDFDSIWFARAGIPSLTLSAQDAAGLIPHLHRPSDTIEHIDENLLKQTVDFSVALVLETLSRMPF